MGVKDNVKVIRDGGISNFSQDFFIFFFEKFQDDLQYFPDYKDYKGKNLELLRSVPSYAEHVGKVVSLMLEIAERSSDPKALAADADRLVKMPQHTKLGTKQFENLFEALVPFLSKKLGGACDKAGWQKVGRDIVKALKTAGM